MFTFRSNSFQYLFAILFVVFSQSVFASQEVAVGQLVPKTADYFLEIVLSLILVLGIIFLSAWMLRRYGRFPGVADGNLRVLGAISVGQREKILLLQVGQEQVLVGVTSSRITALHELKSPIELQQDASPQPKNSFQNSNFAQKLQEAMLSAKSSVNTENNEKKMTESETLPAGKVSDASKNHEKG